MKKNYLLASLLLLGGSLSAQSLNRSDIFFQPGDSYTRHYCDSVDPGPAGNGVTWDLSSIIANSAYDQIETVTTNSGSVYPTASIMVSVQTLDEYYQVSDTLIQVVGRRSIGFPAYYTFSDVIDYMKFPITPAYNYSDTFNYSFISNNGDNMTSNGSLQREFSGYGTLMIPNGTFSDVVRIKSTQITNTLDNTNSFLYHDTLISYDWYKAGVHHLLASVTRRITDSGSFSGSLYMDIPADLGVQESIYLQFSIFPNPSNGTIHIHSDEVISAIEVYQLSGELAMKQQVNNTSSEMDLSALNSGMYLVKVYGQNGAVSVKRISKN